MTRRTPSCSSSVFASRASTSRCHDRRSTPSYQPCGEITSSYAHPHQFLHDRARVDDHETRSSVFDTSVGCSPEMPKPIDRRRARPPQVPRARRCAYDSRDACISARVFSFPTSRASSRGVSSPPRRGSFDTKMKTHSRHSTPSIVVVVVRGRSIAAVDRSPASCLLFFKMCPTDRMHDGITMCPTDRIHCIQFIHPLEDPVISEKTPEGGTSPRSRLETSARSIGARGAACVLIGSTRNGITRRGGWAPTMPMMMIRARRVTPPHARVDENIPSPKARPNTTRILVGHAHVRNHDLYR